MSRPGISVVIPAYNEASTLRPLFARVLDVLRKVTDDFEIILCDDASSDGTKKAIQALTAGCTQARAIYHDQNKGLFATFEELYRAASKDYVLLLPGDGQWDPGFLSEALKQIPACDVVIAARRNKQYSIGRKINSWVFNRLVRWAFGVELYDIGSVKLMRREIFTRVQVTTQSAFTEAERLLKAHKQGYRIGVVWVEHIPRVQGKPSGATVDKMFRALGDLIQFRCTNWPAATCGRHRY